MRQVGRASQRARWTAALVVLAVLPSACLRPQVFGCDAHEECVLDERQGVCLGAGFCAYPDTECDSALRFGPAAGDGMAGECVPLGGSTETDPTIAGTSAGDACGACDTPPDPCHLPAGTCEGGACVYPFAPSGTDCTTDDPCIHAAQCDGAGECVVVDETVCNDPPGPCHAVPGTCLGPGRCSYALHPSGHPCEDGDDCSLGDACDDAGVCQPGPECATANPCAVGNCGVTRQCSFFPKTDGTSCGPQAVIVCCSGECVNLELDDDNCGGCGVACGPGQSCSTIEPTPMCMP